MNQKDLQKARTNPEFLNFLKTKETNALKSNNIAELYEVLDTLLILNLNTDRIDKIYQEILKTSFNQIEKRLTKDDKLTLDNEDIYFIRSFYEHAIEKWSSNNLNGAKELFFILTQIVSDQKFIDAVNIHLLACAKKQDMDNFYDKDVFHQEKVDKEKYAYFIVDFNFDTKEYLNSNKDELANQYDKLKHLLN